MPEPQASAIAESPSSLENPQAPWYREVTRYQWLILAIASAGWIFDAFEGQLFNITGKDLLHDLMKVADPKRATFLLDVFLAIFLAGGVSGGIFFGSLADRIGRKPVMAVTILFYSLFSGLTFFATSLWHVAILRFLVAMGVGGEWAVAAALVSEVFPARARGRAGGIFHATSVMGTWLAALAGMLVGTHWRYAYLMSILPALLLFWVRSGVQEPERWRQATESHGKRGSLRELFSHPVYGRRAIFGMLLAGVGLATFWGVVVAGQGLTHELLKRLGGNSGRFDGQAKFAYGIVQTAGMGLGLLCFGPLAERFGRRGAFLLMHLCALAIVPITCYAPHSYAQMLMVLPFFGFFTGGMHAGYAIYFPELFPDHLRATGAAVCFNGGRMVAAPILVLSAIIKRNVDLRLAVVVLSFLYLLGVLVLLFLPETKGKPLPRD